MASSPICLPRRFRQPTTSPSNDGVGTCGGSAREKLQLEIQVKRKDIGAALAYMGLGHLNLGQNPGKIEFDSVKIELVSGLATTPRRRTQPTSGTCSSARPGRETRAAGVLGPAHAGTRKKWRSELG
jgi:hypothetical protein